MNHTIHIRKMYAYGIRGNILKWWESYLTDRSQYVIYDGIKYNTSFLNCGVPQGSILGPLLFIIFINNIFNVSELLFTVLYADDACFLLEGKHLENRITCLNNELKNITTWLKSNKLTLNVNKTYYMISHRAKINVPHSHPPLCINNSTLSKIQHFKYLGVLLDHTVSWIQHITYVKNKITKCMGITYKARRYLSPNSLVNLYHSYIYIYPYLIYGIESWGNAAHCHLDPLFKLQKNIIIITFSDHNAHTRLIINRLNILPLYKIIQNRIGIMMYNNSNGMLPPVMNELFTVNSNIHEHNTRQRLMLHTNRGHTNIFYRSFNNVGPRIWNALQNKIDVNVLISQFKQNNKKYLQDHSLVIVFPK